MPHWYVQFVKHDFPSTLKYEEINYQPGDVSRHRDPVSDECEKLRCPVLMTADMSWDADAKAGEACGRESLAIRYANGYAVPAKG